MYYTLTEFIHWQVYMKILLEDKKVYKMTCLSIYVFQKEYFNWK